MLNIIIQIIKIKIHFNHLIINMMQINQVSNLLNGLQKVIHYDSIFIFHSFFVFALNIDIL